MRNVIWKYLLPKMQYTLLYMRDNGPPLQIIQRTLIMRGEKGTVQKIRKKSQQLALLFLRRKPFQLCIRLCIQLSLSSFSFLERCGSKNVSLSLFSCTNNLDDGHEKTRSSVVKVKIVFRSKRIYRPFVQTQTIVDYKRKPIQDNLVTQLITFSISVQKASGSVNLLFRV